MMAAGMGGGGGGESAGGIWKRFKTSKVDSGQGKKELEVDDEEQRYLMTKVEMAETVAALMYRQCTLGPGQEDEEQRLWGVLLDIWGRLKPKSWQLEEDPFVEEDRISKRGPSEGPESMGRTWHRLLGISLFSLSGKDARDHVVPLPAH